MSPRQLSRKDLPLKWWESQPFSREGNVHSLDTALVSHSSSESHRCHKLYCPGISMSKDGIKRPAVSEFSLICQGKKINRHSLAWDGEDIRSSKTNVASFFWWGLSALAFTEELDSQIYYVLCICSQYISER